MSAMDVIKHIPKYKVFKSGQTNKNIQKKKSKTIIIRLKTIFKQKFLGFRYFSSVRVLVKSLLSICWGKKSITRTSASQKRNKKRMKRKPKSLFHIRFSSPQNSSIFPFNVAAIVFRFNSSEIGIQLFCSSKNFCCSYVRFFAPNCFRTLSIYPFFQTIFSLLLGSILWSTLCSTKIKWTIFWSIFDCVLSHWKWQ